MEFKIDNRTYQGYQLSNSQLIKLYNDSSLNEEQREYVTESIIEEFKHNLCPEEGETYDELFGKLFSRFANGMIRNKNKVAETMAMQHRYLQEEMFLVCLSYIKKLAENYNKLDFDGRNVYACKTSHKIIEMLNQI